jgi:glycosyltransferase involved in cell wall biosynthesis
MSAKAPSANDVREILRSGTPVPGRVSVIVPVYNGERFVLGAIRSALRQTYPELEVFVVNDGSTDGTAARLADVNDPRVTILEQPNQGLSAARNCALARASGEYIAFLDADDRWFADKLATDVRVLRASAPKPAGVVYGWYYAVDDRGRFLHRSRPYGFSGNVFDIMLATGDFILPSASFFHRAVFEQIGGFDVGTYHEDTVFFLRAAQSFPVFPTRRYSAVYRQSIAGLGRRSLIDFDRARNEMLSVVDSMRPHLSAADTDVLRKQQLRSLYFQFLMYGFGASATRMLADVDTTSLRHGVKGSIAWLHAKSGINLMCPLRLSIQGANLVLGQRKWNRTLRREGLDLQYGAP